WFREDPAPANQGRFIYNMYSLSHTPNPFPYYNVSDWDKRVTKFSTIRNSSSNIFLYTLVSNSTLVSNAKAANPNLTALAGTNYQNGLVSGSLVYFLTPEGKYGAFYVNATGTDYEGRRYISFSIKMEK